MLQRAAQFSVFVGVWLLFVGRAAWSEAAAGMGAAAVATLAATLVRRNRPPFLPRWRELAKFGRIPAMVLRGCALLARNLLRTLQGESRPGRLVTLPFEAGGTDANAVAHRALAILLHHVAAQLHRDRHRPQTELDAAPRSGAGRTG